MHVLLRRTSAERRPEPRDNEVAQADAVIALRMAVNGEWSEDADVSGDDQVTSLDALLILQVAASDIEL